MRNLKYTMLRFGGRYILLFTAIAALTLSACKKEDKDEQSGGTSNLSVDSITGTHEIYVALSFDSIYSSGHSRSYAALLSQWAEIAATDIFKRCLCQLHLCRRHQCLRGRVRWHICRLLEKRRREFLA
jgi:hypothetical protein